MQPVCRDIILAGDFNSIIDKRYSTSQTNISRALATLIGGRNLCDVWDTVKNRNGYTYYASKAASRLDRIYVTKRLYSRKTGVERVAGTLRSYYGSQ
jgi:endonuclease/exonuclease/phosphatase family metal-dependent hydrolase